MLMFAIVKVRNELVVYRQVVDEKNIIISKFKKENNYDW